MTEPLEKSENWIYEIMEILKEFDNEQILNAYGSTMGVELRLELLDLLYPKIKELIDMREK